MPTWVDPTHYEPEQRMNDLKFNIASAICLPDLSYLWQTRIRPFWEADDTQWVSTGLGRSRPVGARSISAYAPTEPPCRRLVPAG